MVLSEVLQIIILTFFPFLELRASIPYGILATDIHWLLVFIIAVIANIALGIILYLIIDKIIFVVRKIPFINRLYEYVIIRAQKRIRKYVDRYGDIGVAIFIGIPLPGSGVYTGALGSYLIGLSYKKFFIANIIGVLIAGILVTIITLTGSEVFSFFIKT
jgi:uncharacterized membrane protein